MRPLLSRLGFSGKMALLAILLSMPAVMVITSLVRATQNYLHDTRLESAGIVHIEQIQAVLEFVLEHRG